MLGEVIHCAGFLMLYSWKATRVEDALKMSAVRFKLNPMCVV